MNAFVPDFEIVPANAIVNQFILGHANAIILNCDCGVSTVKNNLDEEIGLRFIFVWVHSRTSKR